MKEQTPGEADPKGPNETPGPETTPPTADDPPQQRNAGDPPPIVIEPLRAELDATVARLRETEGRLREVSKAYRDLEADMDAFRRRAQAAADQRAERRANDVVEQFFEPVRNLRRSVDAAGSDPAAVLEGLKMVAWQFDDTMKRLGLTEIPGVGATFDPQIHEALATSPVPDKEQDNKVIFVHAAGFRIGTKVLQPAQVVIGKFSETPTEA